MWVHLTVAPSDRWTSYRSYGKEVNWPHCPGKDDVIFVGQDEYGSSASINARVTLVAFSTHGRGEVTVEALIEHCRKEYDSICQSVERDGFVLRFTKNPLGQQ